MIFFCRGTRTRFSCSQSKTVYLREFFWFACQSYAHLGWFCQDCCCCVRYCWICCHLLAFSFSWGYFSAYSFRLRCIRSSTRHMREHVHPREALTQGTGENARNAVGSGTLPGWAGDGCISYPPPRSYPVLDCSSNASATVSKSVMVNTLSSRFCRSGSSMCVTSSRSCDSICALVLLI